MTPGLPSPKFHAKRGNLGDGYRSEVDAAVSAGRAGLIAQLPSSGTVVPRGGGSRSMELQESRRGCRLSTFATFCGSVSRVFLRA
jgi:hypothetical protein